MWIIRNSDEAITWRENGTEKLAIWKYGKDAQRVIDEYGLFGYVAEPYDPAGATDTGDRDWET